MNAWSRLPRALPVLINGFALCCLAFTPAIAEGDCTGTCDYDGATAVLAMSASGSASQRWTARSPRSWSAARGS